MKQPYKVPSMDEVADLRGSSGLTVASTFSGCGGSCLGFKMAGFNVLTASEILQEAVKAYRENNPEVSLYGDIRKINGDALLSDVGVGKGGIDVLEGSPPCTPFSTITNVHSKVDNSMAGKKSWGKEIDYHGVKQRTDDLFFEYVRLLEELRPKAFVAENVAGMAKGASKGYFKFVLQALRAAGYVVEARILDAARLGVPQVRRRVIFIGMREDLGLSPQFPKPQAVVYSVRDALPWVTGLRYINGFHAKQIQNIHKPVDTILTGNISGEPYEVTRDMSRVPDGVDLGKLPKRQFSPLELKRLSSFPDDFKTADTPSVVHRLMGRCVPPLMMRAVAETVRDTLLNQD
jgi:DNA (cytosine-5)-methyltransferase 1